MFLHKSAGFFNIIVAVDQTFILLDFECGFFITHLELINAFFLVSKVS